MFRRRHVWNEEVFGREGFPVNDRSQLANSRLVWKRWSDSSRASHYEECTNACLVCWPWKVNRRRGN